ncbi:alpha/beta hydrolase [Hansschlegelia beijingensis]
MSAAPLSEAEFLSQTAAAAARSRGPRRGVGVFVHGYNYTFQESLFRLAQMDADADVGGAAVLFAWPSQGALTGYVADKEAVTYSRDGLAHVIAALAKNARGGGVTVFGHSMGGWLTVEALRQLRLTGQDRVIARLDDIVLAAPDIDVDVFRQQLIVVGRLSPPITLLVSKDDRALSASRLLSGDRDRIGALDVSDPEVQEVVKSENLRVVDISQLTSENRTNHDRFAAFAAIYPQLQSQLETGSGNAAQKAGIFVLDAAAATLQTPFRAAGAILGQR